MYFHPISRQESLIIAQFDEFRNTGFGSDADRGRVVLKDKFLPKEGKIFHNVRSGFVSRLDPADLRLATGFRRAWVLPGLATGDEPQNPERSRLMVKV